MQSSRGVLAKMNLDSQNKFKFTLNTNMDGWSEIKEKLTDLLPYYRDVTFIKGTIENARFMMNKFLQANPQNSFRFPVNFEAILSNSNFAKKRNGSK